MVADEHELIGAYAVDALAPDERAAFEQHLAGCAGCRAELVELREPLAGLAELTATEPPAGLRARVLAAAGQSPASQVDAADGAAGGRPDRTSAPVSSLAERRAARGVSGWQWLVAAAVAVVAVIGVAVWQPWAPRAITAADVLAAPDAVRATAPAVGGGTVTVVRSNTLGRAVLVTEAIREAASGRVRQAWVVRPGGALVSGGLMPAGSSVTYLLEGDARDAAGAGVSEEPPGGSPQPTTVIAVVQY